MKRDRRSRAIGREKREEKRWIQIGRDSRINEGEKK
jgi:hypothetical protein